MGIHIQQNDNQVQNRFAKDNQRQNLKKIFIGHLPKSLSESELLATLSQVCEIESISMIVDKERRSSKGMCEVDLFINRLCVCICRLKRKSGPAYPGI